MLIILRHSLAQFILTTDCLMPQSRKETYISMIYEKKRREKRK